MIVTESSLRAWWKENQVSREQIINDLTMLGLEVDGVTPVANFTNVVVGEVVECNQHPNADKLRVTKVNVGTEVLDIVCGAPNCRLGLKVCVAKVGAVLPGDFKIVPAKLRGEPSNGMLCSWTELGQEIEGTGIIELPADAPIGTSIIEYLGLDDVVVEIGLTANRGDCLSALGVARDLAAKYRLETNFEEVKEKTLAQNLTSHDEVFPVELENKEACPFYCSRVIKNVDVNRPSPLWLVQFLARYGVRSIDPVVDVTNYVLHNFGQPLHAFDKAKLDGKIIVRSAKEGEKLTLLSGDEATLKANTLVIADQKGPVALAGIFGGLDSGVTSETKDIVLEAAYFDHLAIVNRARQYGLHTDASHRYERGVDPALLSVAQEVATKLILEICGGEAGPANYVGSAVNNVKNVTLEHSLLERISGMQFEEATVIEILTALGCTVEHDYDAKSYHVETPSWRFDLNIPEDLAEEVLRIHGYDFIPTEAPLSQLVMREHREVEVPLAKVKSLLINQNFQETISYSFVDPKQQALFHPGEETLDLPFPISIEMSQMRLSLFTNMLNNLSYNLKRQAKTVRMFETGLCFTPDKNAELEVRQETMVGGLLYGNRHPEGWNRGSESVDFYDLKGIVEDLFALTKAGKEHLVHYEAAEVPGFHPGQTAKIFVDGQEVGVLGKIHPSVMKPFDVKTNNVFLFQVKASALSETFVPSIVPVSKFPSNKRDIALLVNKDVAVGDMLACARNAGTELLYDLSLFDVFTSEELGSEKKSVALTLTIGSREKTLEDQEIAAEVERVVKALETTFSAQLREV